VTFLAAGIISARFMWTDDCTDHSGFKGMAWLELFGLYIFIHITRALVLAIFSPVLLRLGYGLSWKECTILIYGGLRGAVGLIVGLIVEHEQGISPGVRQMIAFHTSGIVLLTLFINGSTIDGLYKRLKLYPINPFSQKHMRKVLSKLEVECQKGGIRVVSHDWFFMGCDFKRILKCVPNFQHIHFNEGGAPHPTGIEEVNETLRSLEHETNTMSAATMGHAPTYIFESSFQKLWQDRKCAANEHFQEMINSSNEMNDTKDTMTKVGTSSHADNLLNFKASERDANPGIYISSRPLGGQRGVVTRDEGETAYTFEVKIVKADQAHVIIGFLAGLRDLDDERDLEPSMGNQVLGLTSNSVGFDTSTGDLLYNGPLGKGKASSQPGAIEPGTTLTVQVDRKPGSEWEVSYWMPIQRATDASGGSNKDKDRVAAGSSRIGACSFGPFPPNELYPVVEFRPDSEVTTGWSTSTGNAQPRGRSSVRNSTGMPLGNIVAKVGQTAGDVIGKVTTLAAGEQATVKKRRDSASGSAIDASMKSMSPDGKTEEDTRTLTKDSSGSLPGNVGDPDGQATAGSDEDPMNPPMDTQAVRSNSKTPKVQVSVEISWEPQLATDSESINELFQVLFNTLRHKYHDFHEHGIIGDVPLAWLQESIGNALDCANNEVGAMRGMANNSGRGFSPASKIARQVTNAFANANNTTPTSVSSASKVFNPFRTDNKKAKLVALFEPLVVEYQCLEMMIGKESFIEILPRKMTRMFHSIEFSHVKAKIESLWAFIEAHEKVMSESPTLQRFPDMMRCLRRVVDEARSDLEILQDIRPRSFFFTKHLLLLRILLNRRVEKLSKYIREGWLSDGDGIKLKEAFFERIGQVDQFWPHIDTMKPKNSNELVHSNSSTSDDSRMRRSQSNKGAWADVDLPSPA
jgi:hypothetical protein